MGCNGVDGISSRVRGATPYNGRRATAATSPRRAHPTAGRPRGDGSGGGEGGAAAAAAPAAAAQEEGEEMEISGGGIDALCHDALVDIFVRLPSESVLRCRALCKSWRRITTDCSFLAAHAARSPREMM
ncbi:hypothetical protein C2845_PM05G27630 [Panicum miliaceum]|uniref:F-box domain-containing protein n=1 Tax=Panicum miliaceum TaxID=4540 RepID=A0A3L6SXB6_PANMI|nr:hypothetical protein C2845_PM05G27630 [Panicum miliaceum]